MKPIYNYSHHAAQDVAKWFLAYNKSAEFDDGAELISNLKLQKLLYYAQGSYLALYDEPLFDDQIEAWQHGPVIPAVYHEYKSFGASGIEMNEDFDLKKFDDRTRRLLEEVYDVFGQYSAWKLRNMTHEETPWKEAESDGVISQESIKEYFKENYLEG